MSIATGSIAFVTGASAGTGREIALALAGEGHDVAVLGRRTAALDDLVGEIEGLGRRALALTADVRDAGQLAAALDGLLAWSGGRVDVVVNAAGTTGPLSPPIGQYSLEDFDSTVATNLRAPFIVLSRLLPVMRAAGQGRIIMIGGNHGMRGRAGRSSYSASKWGLRGLARSAALEAGPDGVTVNYIAPGPIAIPRMKAAWKAQAEAGGVSEEEALRAYVANMGIPLGKPSEAQDIVAMVLYLAGPGGRNITGQELVIDGGATVL
ncbi:MULTISPECIES: SDR family NAD(P)-dependent oxidoreductase [unclassified Novosphingobium]|uniref:SDR family NAD(P)-dependent oxidoreductase n=1 Tax=unclassified Novosphingobium TaxID=2644732 RepID=UPI00146ADCCF|nr:MULTISPECIES: SDR family NAD(P)-dependent oxidoreductase [unclassified Novosphingobium]NMN05121.1 3-hydroxybutyrate dehydrogenase/3-oxoacyl-[acyl-carrier protein] reductase [Novosphingobium sp. SG919]NMN87416.1 3-hydroxybutyrate dehydrogenase/3-oxoacyl-[acyl-carrier protein] reductase [Novosphingobium sp. SG916]